MLFRSGFVGLAAMKEHPVEKRKSSSLFSTIVLFSASLTISLFPQNGETQETASGKVARPPQDPTLRGRIEQRNGLEKLGRPSSGLAGLNESVRILSGQNSPNEPSMDGLLNANSKEDVLNSTLDSNNFELNTNSSAGAYRPATPHSDWNELSSATGTMRTKKPCDPCHKMNMMLWRRYGHGPGPGPWDEYGAWVVTAMPGGGRDDWRLQIDKVRASLGSSGAGGSLFPDNRWNLAPVGSPLRPPMISQNWTIPPVQPGPPPDKPIYVDQNIGWDAWYKTISDALYKNWSKLNSLPGEAKLRISVSAGRSISAEILSTNNFKPEFKDGLNKAVASLNGSTILEFPQASKRRTVSFESVFTAGTQNSAGSFSERNEIEHIRLRK